ncbi:MAG: hypothetical protein KGS60_04730 [Verrucomicrobia bacterium]|nr:hypothetical protein [Verrucomicrobiota bacterium]
MAQAQVIIYRISFTHVAGYNVDFYDGGYLVAPALGGLPSLVMINRDASGAATYSPAVSGGDFFIGLDKDKRLMATFGCKGRGDASLCAFGPVLSSMRLKSTAFDLQVRLARTLSGGVVASSGENGEKGPDGTIGFAQHSNVVMEMDASLTEEANTLGGQPGDGVSVVNAFLESHGFQPEDPVPVSEGERLAEP